MDVTEMSVSPQASMSSKSARSGGHVERDAVIGHALLDPQAEGAELARRTVEAEWVQPATRIAVAPLGGDAVARRGIDHGQLQGTHERPQQHALQSASRTMGYATSWPGPW